MHRYYGAALGFTDYQHLDIIPAYSYDMHHTCECKRTGKKRVETSMYISNKLGIIQQFFQCSIKYILTRIDLISLMLVVMCQQMLE